MDELKLCESDFRFMDIVWENEPVSSGKLVELCTDKLGWKKSTTYTVLKRLCEKGIFENIGGSVTVKISRDAFYALQSQQFVENAFQGSLPAFLAAFTNGKKLSAQEVAQLRQMVQSFEEDI